MPLSGLNEKLNAKKASSHPKFRYPSCQTEKALGHPSKHPNEEFIGTQNPLLPPGNLAIACTTVTRTIISEFCADLLQWCSEYGNGFKSSHSNIFGRNHQIDVVRSSHDIGSIILKQNDHGWLKFNRAGLR
ncbi:hypothetical protein CEXT_136101 [Caerostris extrusa]|uniref:Uncharacterized protein n=1 Tax=Caerostris extrusa TaxID=172846 RepID=A0AAV4MLN3_CAEEX|nr:hypothetical protein CEXT_136101 [Caerostris extrusa]